MTYFQALLAASQPGLHELTIRAACGELCCEAEQAGWQCFCVDGSTVHDKASFLSTFAAALHFPSYFGHNWDAFEECLNDMLAENQQDSKGIVILFDGASAFAHNHPADWATASSILYTAAATWAKHGKTILILERGVPLQERIEAFPVSLGWRTAGQSWVRVTYNTRVVAYEEDKDRWLVVLVDIADAGSLSTAPAETRLLIERLAGKWAYVPDEARAGTTLPLKYATLTGTQWFFYTHDPRLEH